MSHVRIPINLATQPFRKDRAMVVASSVTAVLLLAVFGLLVNIVLNQREAARDSRELMAQVDAQLKAINLEQRAPGSPTCASRPTPRCSIAACF